MTFSKIFLAGLCACTFLSAPALACDQHHTHDVPCDCHDMHTSEAIDHAPLGVMGDHMHEKGEWMLSYRYMRMDMGGNRDGTTSLTPAEIVTNTPNRFFGNPMQPPNLRVVPTEMFTDMHMLGLMYAPTDWVTLMVMGQYLEKNMEHITFAGMAGTAQLGTFETSSKGWGDTSVSGLFKLYEDDVHHVHLNAGISLPTGDIDKTDTVLTPMGARMNMRLPYGMQLGSGTYDALPGVTYIGEKGKLGWGAQYSARIPIESENSENYKLGDKHEVTTWGAYSFAPWISTSVRVSMSTQDNIDGIDPQIMAPVQTADPDNYGGEVVTAGFGVNLLGQKGALKDHRLAFEVTVPVYQNLNGPQMERDYTATVGWQYAF